ncbi:VOC family protein [Novosphingobium aquiterrae]|uniref:VOC family protein n=1 Tax=Novosphingobium aquiterrae TaxID=624388 RepID=A0ABV6PGG2_9SPHN
MSKIIGIDHVQLAMPGGGEDIARGFYAALLGLNEAPKPMPLAARGGCWFEAPGVKIHLGVEADFRAAQNAHPALLVDDLKALAALIEQTGGQVRWDTELPGVLRCHVADPFGNRIELIQA